MVYLGLALIMFALTGAGCSGYIVAPMNAGKASEAVGREDGALISYYLPKAIWRVTASYDASTGLITITPDTKPTAIADTWQPMQALSYGHAKFSDDDFDIFFDGMMIKSIASKSSDQTVKIVEAANALITQAGSTSKALSEKGLVTTTTTLPIPLSNAGCTTNLKSEVLVELSYQTEPKQNDLLWSEDCGLKIRAVRELVGSPPARGVPLASSQNLAEPGDACLRAICFRPSGIVKVHVTVSLQSDQVKDKDGKTTKVSLYTVKLPKLGGSGGESDMTYTQTVGPVVVPIATRRLPFVEFSRRAFVENHTTLAFTDGVLSEFHSTDPSIVAGAITLSSDLLKSVALTVPLVR